METDERNHDGIRYVKFDNFAVEIVLWSSIKVDYKHIVFRMFTLPIIRLPIPFVNLYMYVYVYIYIKSAINGAPIYIYINKCIYVTMQAFACRNLSTPSIQG